jgi:hypothetical protein
MSFRKYVYVCAFVAVAGIAPAQAGIYQELTPDQQNQLNSGEQVFNTVDVDGAPWPKVYIYQLIKATPEDAMAVFSDYNLQKSYIPNMLKSQITSHNGATTTVDYTLHVPILSNENYTIRDVISSYDGGQAYRMDWNLVRADTTKSTVGNVRFEKYGSETVMAYYNFVVPGSSFASFVRGKAIQAVKDTCNAIASQVETEATDNQTLLQQQLSVLHTSLH